MKYGHFDDARKEYVITRPNTPRSWTNYIGDRKFGGVITNNAGGYSFTRSPAEGRITRFRYNAVPADQAGRYFYLRDRESGDFWSSSWQPVGKPLTQYKSVCRFGTGYAEITSKYKGIETVSTYFVPLGQQFEYWVLKVKNTSKRARKLSTFTFAEFTSEWNLMNDLLNIQYTAYIAEATHANGVISASSCGRLPEDLGNFANRDQSRWFYMALRGAEVVGYDLDRDKFIGGYRSFHNPIIVQQGHCSNSVGFSDNLCGTMQCDIDLAPGETRELVVILGIGKADTVGAGVIAEYATPERAAVELVKLKNYWHGILENFSTKTPDADFDHMINVWNAYNALVTFEWSRACSLVYTGDSRDGFGFRDTVQDFLGVIPAIPERVQERLELMLTGQESTGGARPEIRPWLHKPGEMKPTPAHEYRSDDCLWFFNAVPTFVAETGDVSFYNKEIPYSDTGSATVFGHLRRALEFNLERTGKNGLPCGLLADWNDCLKLGYHGESVFVAFQVRYGLTQYAEIAALLGRPEEKEWALAQRESLDAKIQKVCWDGEWFIWAIAEDGTVFGTKDYSEGQIYLNTQVWAVISGAATPEQREKCLDSVQAKLATEFGLRLCNPPFSKTPVKVMRAVLMNPGNKENGGIFSHTQSWGVMAEILRGNGDKAFEYYRAFMPSAYNDRAEVREIEPYAHCQSTHGPDSKKFGVSRVSWLSGTATWSYYSATQWLLGVRPEVAGLRIDPCIPKSWPGFTVTRRFRGKTVKITVKNPDGVSHGVKSLKLNGKAIEGNLIAVEQLTDGAKVDVILG
ncbi:MAG: N,N'-diacetylchitobiose phosphorylase [Verrucomicrobiota bacterium]|nr:N,N'-diacetylchitobiose phosphorylase [Verrucomicrobiota bacterium]